MNQQLTFSVVETDDKNAGNWCPKPLNTENASVIFSDGVKYHLTHLEPFYNRSLLNS